MQVRLSLYYNYKNYIINNIQFNYDHRCAISAIVIILLLIIFECKERNPNNYANLNYMHEFYLFIRSMNVLSTDVLS